MSTKHLGGHCGITHLDEGAINWAMSMFDVRSMLDVGCGPGGMVELALRKGLDAHGVDGDANLQRNWFNKNYFTLHDFQTGPAPITDKYDLCWSVEFVEHVHEQYIPNFVATYKQCGILIMTHATPGQGGYHHVNEQPEGYWIEKISSFNFQFDRDLTDRLRRATTMNINHRKWAPYVKLTGLVFINS